MPNYSDMLFPPLTLSPYLSQYSYSNSIIYIITALQNNRPLIWALIPCRALAAWIFWPYGGVWRKVAVFEAFCGGVMAVAMLLEGSWGRKLGAREGKRKGK